MKNPAKNTNSQICGIDEAGRGALAGELVIAGCVFTGDLSEIEKLNLTDSKKLSEKKREKIFVDLLPNCEFLAVFFNNKIIDDLGLSECLRRGLKAIKSHFSGRDFIDFIYDGNCDYGVSGVKTLIKADDKIKEVSAASIIAKCLRDAQMRRFDALFPAYGYAGHKGYGCKAHIEALKIHGANEITRKSFCVKALEKTLFD